MTHIHFDGGGNGYMDVTFDGFRVFDANQQRVNGYRVTSAANAPYAPSLRVPFQLAIATTSCGSVSGVVEEIQLTLDGELVERANTFFSFGLIAEAEFTDTDAQDHGNHSELCNSRLWGCGHQSRELRQRVFHTSSRPMAN